MTNFQATNPSQLPQQTFLLNPPFSFSSNEPNNIVMEEIPEDRRAVDLSVAFEQFTALYQVLAAEGLVYCLPTPKGCTLQDLTFVANLGMVLEHLPEKPIVLSNFTSPPRVGEELVGRDFFALHGYETILPPHKFEGEADLKHVAGNVYIGGYGLRSERACFDWMEREFDMNIIKVKVTNPYLYHLDCNIFSLSPEKSVVCVELFSDEEIKAIEAVSEIIPITYEEAYMGASSAVRVGNKVVNGSHLAKMERDSRDYAWELQKNRRFEEYVTAAGLEPAFVDLSEFTKGGALLSCLVMHLNRRVYQGS